MTRSTMREHIFKLLFRAPFIDNKDEYEEQINLYFADADIETKPCSLPTCCWHSIPFASAPDFVSELRELCIRLDVDLLVPGVDEELQLIAEAKDAFNCEILMPSPEFIKIHLKFG